MLEKQHLKANFAYKQETKYLTRGKYVYAFCLHVTSDHPVLVYNLSLVNWYTKGADADTEFMLCLIISISNYLYCLVMLYILKISTDLTYLLVKCIAMMR